MTRSSSSNTYASSSSKSGSAFRDALDRLPRHDKVSEYVKHTDPLERLLVTGESSRDSKSSKKRDSGARDSKRASTGRHK
ncbi:hypothetical protein PG987_012380 [Apiospora arundinis]|uniref:Uncharacterized protein n=1 Tax=Apiospora arundinis TaxID=335852 RepID=A0ABR2IF57_9PEZI